MNKLVHLIVNAPRWLVWSVRALLLAAILFVVIGFARDVSGGSVIRTALMSAGALVVMSAWVLLIVIASMPGRKP